MVQHLILLFDSENVCADILILESKTPKPLKFTNLFFSSLPGSLYLPVSTSHVALPTNVPIADLPVGTPLVSHHVQGPLVPTPPSQLNSCSFMRKLKLLT